MERRGRERERKNETQGNGKYGLGGGRGEMQRKREKRGKSENGKKEKIVEVNLAAMLFCFGRRQSLFNGRYFFSLLGRTKREKEKGFLEDVRTQVYICVSTHTYTHTYIQSDKLTHTLV